MTLTTLAGMKELSLLNNLPEGEKEITGGICCDLLSWVMAKGQAGMAWITVQTHMNVVAVASLHEFACIILVEGCRMPEDVLQKASDEGIAVFGSALSGYRLCGLLHSAGVD